MTSMSDPNPTVLHSVPPPPPPQHKNVCGGGIIGDVLANRVSELSARSKFQSPQSIVRHLVSNLPLSRSRDFDEPSVEDTSAYQLLSFFRAVSPVIQVGPSCGLVALALAGQLLTGCTIDPELIMSAGVTCGYTRYGEMFSADNLLSLSSQFLPTCTGHVVLPESERCEKIKKIIETLAHRGAVLVPYDRDSNSEPCLRQGHRAHWVLLTGAVLVVKASTIPIYVHASYEADPVIPQLLHAVVDEQCDELCDSHWLHSNSKHIYVYAVHGRSTRTCLWSLADLLDSNEQLIAMDPRRQISSDGELTDYCVPAGGVQAGLCGKIILLSKPSFA